jgi:alkanesulfonate monooxygenase SsuD/methylene tetrahydromethanopterin reductase-like flavin-dependent oxidoreductase (luciferase family)
MLTLGITDHLEGPRDGSSADVYSAVARQTQLADEVGIEYAWFAEHHAHAHHGHCPPPLLFALHMAGRTRRIRLGTAIICLNLHHPLDVAEQCATADLLMDGRGAFGFGSGSTPEEFELFGEPVTEEAPRHGRFEVALRLIKAAWSGRVEAADGAPFGVPPHQPLPVAASDMTSRSWVAANSIGAARIAGALGFNMLFSHLRTPAQYRDYAAAYRAAGATGLIAANRPVHLAADDATAWTRAEPALRSLWRRFRAEGKIPAQTPEPNDACDLCRHPINFLVGSAQTVARQLKALHDESPFDVANLEVRWAGLSEDAVLDCVRLLGTQLLPRLRYG